MKIRKIGAAALAAALMTGTAVTAFAEDEIDAVFKAKVDSAAELYHSIKEASDAFTEKYGTDPDKLTEEQREAAQSDLLIILFASLEFDSQLKEIEEMIDNGEVSEAEANYAKEQLREYYEALENMRYPGDVNNDKNVNVADVTLILKHVAQIQTLTGDDFTAADIDGDEKITVADATAVLKMIASGIYR